MFSKGKSSDTEAQKQRSQTPSAPADQGARTTAPPSAPAASQGAPAPAGSKAKPSPSLLSSDLLIKGNVSTTGDIQIEGTIEGDVRAHLLTVGETATIRGEVIADDVVVNGRVVGRLRGLKVRLTASARVEGDIVHKSIAIESGAHFEGSVQRSEDPLGDGGQASSGQAAAKSSAGAKAGGSTGAAEKGAASGTAGEKKQSGAETG